MDISRKSVIITSYFN